jgi:hypothetical protein
MQAATLNRKGQSFESKLGNNSYLSPIILIPFLIFQIILVKFHVVLPNDACTNVTIANN